MSQFSTDSGPARRGRRNTMLPKTEARLVAAAKAGDHSAFAELVRATEAGVYTLAFRLTGNREDADDVVQEAYLRAFKAIKRFRGDGQFFTWMYRITVNCASSMLSRRNMARHDELVEDGDSFADERPESDPESMAEAGMLRDKLTAALVGLSPALRVVVVLRDVYDLSIPAIAKELDITETATKVRLHRARRKLREGLFPLQGDDVAQAV